MKLLRMDCFPVTEDEAVELTIHHLRLAAVFFMNTPEDNGEALETEARRLFERQNIHDRLPIDHASIEANAVAAFIKAAVVAANAQKD